MLDGLFRVSPRVEYVPDPDQGTASSTISGGKQVVTIKIDPDAVWADGQPITAQDYLFTVETQQSSAMILSKHVFDQGSSSATCAYITKGWPVAGGIPLGAQNGPWLLSTVRGC